MARVYSQFQEWARRKCCRSATDFATMTWPVAPVIALVSLLAACAPIMLVIWQFAKQKRRFSGGCISCLFLDLDRFDLWISQMLFLKFLRSIPEFITLRGCIPSVRTQGWKRDSFLMGANYASALWSKQHRTIVCRSRENRWRVDSQI